MTSGDAAKLVTDLESCQKESELKLQEAQEVCTAEKDALQQKIDLEAEYATKTCDVEKEYCEKRIDLLEKQLDRELKPNVLKDVRFGFAMGVVVTAGAAVLLAVGVNEFH